MTSKYSTPYCESIIQTPNEDKHYNFCELCRSEHSYYVLTIQAQHGYPIKDVILDAASLFKNVTGMADYVGVSFVTMYNWLRKYFNVSFGEFKRQYICKSSRCYSLDIRNSSYNRSDYILRKLKQKYYCACSNIFEKGQIITNAPKEIANQIIKSAPPVDTAIVDHFQELPVAVSLIYPVYVVYPVTHL
jgi:hypothetical protein